MLECLLKEVLEDMIRILSSEGDSLSAIQWLKIYIFDTKSANMATDKPIPSGGYTQS